MSTALSIIILAIFAEGCRSSFSKIKSLFGGCETTENKSEKTQQQKTNPRKLNNKKQIRENLIKRHIAVRRVEKILQNSLDRIEAEKEC